MIPYLNLPNLTLQHINKLYLTIPCPTPPHSTAIILINEHESLPNYTQFHNTPQYLTSNILVNEHDSLPYLTPQYIISQNNTPQYLTTIILVNEYDSLPYLTLQHPSLHQHTITHNTEPFSTLYHKTLI